MQTIDLNQAKHHLPELVQQTIQGAEVIITQEGRPVVKLVAMAKQTQKQRRFGSAKGLFTMSADFNAPLEDFKEYS